MATFLCTETAKFRLGGCYCSTNGTIKCDVYGNCICREGYTGTKCDQCQSGYSKNASGMCIGMKGLIKFASTWIIVILACKCNTHGSIGIACDSAFQCRCKANFKVSLLM